MVGGSPPGPTDSTRGKPVKIYFQLELIVRRFDLTRHWLDGEISSILASLLRFLRLFDDLIRPLEHADWNR